MTWLLCDYGDVLSAPQDPAARSAMAALCGLDDDAFATAYWVRRADYDLGAITAQEFWATVVGGDPGDRLDELVAHDVAGWTHLRPASLAAVSRAAGRGMRPAILSNAPREVAEAVDRLPELGTFSPRLFSWALGMVKPDPAIYRRALAELGAAPSEVVFVDDRPDNVTAAQTVGIDARLFTGPADLDA